MLMASRAKAPVLSASQPAATPVQAPGEEEAARKREADGIDAPSAKRARTVSESEAAANALLDEMAAEHPVEQAPTDDEALQGAQQGALGRDRIQISQWGCPAIDAVHCALQLR